MKPFHLKLSILLFLTMAAATSNAQLEGNYNVSGYFFHPSVPRDISLTKSITKISANVYQAEVGDLVGYGYIFQFEVDAGNHLINWVAISGLPSSPASGFMTLDNPAGLSTYPGTTTGFTSNIYDNTYDPVSRTLYVHYGYTSGTAGQGGYTRQIYEKWVMIPAPSIQSVSPLAGTSGTVVTITGQHLTKVNQVLFGGNFTCDFKISSDTKITAIVGSGNSGTIEVYTPTGGVDSFAGFTYQPPVITNPQWQPVGNAGFSAPSADYVNMAKGPNNIPFVIYSDGSDGSKAHVMRLGPDDKWVDAGSAASEGACRNTNIAIDQNNVPYINYIDYINGRKVSVRKFVNGNWVNVGNPGFITSAGLSSIVFDNNNLPYILSLADTTYGNVSVLKFDGTNWQYVGEPCEANNSVFVDAALAIDKQTNTPYIISDGQSGDLYYPVVRKFNGSEWTDVGTQEFATATNGIFYPDIEINDNGYPIISFQQDDGRERVSIYEFNGNDWEIRKQYLSPGEPAHAHFVSQSLIYGISFVLFSDDSYNEQGTVMQQNSNGDGTWLTTGTRGAIPASYFGRNAMFIDSSGKPYVAFTDKNTGRATVMKYDPYLVDICPGAGISLNAHVYGENYQWQILLPESTTWANVDASFTGSQTNQLIRASLPTTFYGTRFRCTANGYYGNTYTVRFKEFWTGQASVNWADPANWSCNVLPDANTDVVINRGNNTDILIQSDISVRSLQINPSVHLNVAAGHKLEIKK